MFSASLSLNQLFVLFAFHVQLGDTDSFRSLQALSINKSLLKVKSAAEDGVVDCEKLRNLVIQRITEAGGRIDYAEVRYYISSFSVFSLEYLMKFLHKLPLKARCSVVGQYVV